MPSNVTVCNKCTVCLSIYVMRQEKVLALLSRAQFMETPLSGVTLEVGCVCVA